MARPKPLLLFTAIFLSLLLFTHDGVLAQAPAQGGKEAGKEIEKLELHVDTIRDLLTIDGLAGVDVPSFSERSGAGKGFFLIPIVAGYAATKGVQAIQKMIDNRKSRFTASYAFAQRDHYFYDQVSTTGPFDPTGMQFKGFTIVRLLKHKGAGKEEKEDTVFMAKFIVDTTEGKCAEIMNNGIFRLRLDTLMITRGKVRAPKNPRELNLDFEIDFTATYRTEEGGLFSDAPMGKFVYPLRKARPYEETDTLIRHYYDSLDRTKPKLTGQCFMIPRSAGYYKTKNGAIESCWGKGLYAITVSVKETSKMKFIDRLIVFSSDPALNVGSTALQKKVSAMK